MEDKHNGGDGNRKSAWLAVLARRPERRCDGFAICSSETWPQGAVNEGLGEIGR